MMALQNDPMNMSSGSLPFFFVALSGAASLITLVFWLVIGWRAMRAHEQIARELRELNRPQ